MKKKLYLILLLLVGYNTITWSADSDGEDEWAQDARDEALATLREHQNTIENATAMFNLSYNAHWEDIVTEDYTPERMLEWHKQNTRHYLQRDLTPAESDLVENFLIHYWHAQNAGNDDSRNITRAITQLTKPIKQEINNLPTLRATAQRRGFRLPEGYTYQTYLDHLTARNNALQQQKNQLEENILSLPSYTVNALYYLILQEDRTVTEAQEAYRAALDNFRRNNTEENAQSILDTYNRRTTAINAALDHTAAIAQEHRDLILWLYDNILDTQPNTQKTGNTIKRLPLAATHRTLSIKAILQQIAEIDSAGEGDDLFPLQQDSLIRGLRDLYSGPENSEEATNNTIDKMVVLQDLTEYRLHHYTQEQRGDYQRKIQEFLSALREIEQRSIQAQEPEPEDTNEAALGAYHLQLEAYVIDQFNDLLRRTDIATIDLDDFMQELSTVDDRSLFNQPNGTRGLLPDNKQIGLRRRLASLLLEARRNPQAQPQEEEDDDDWDQWDETDTEDDDDDDGEERQDLSDQDRAIIDEYIEQIIAGDLNLDDVRKGLARDRLEHLIRHIENHEGLNIIQRMAEEFHEGLTDRSVQIEDIQHQYALELLRSMYGY